MSLYKFTFKFEGREKGAIGIFYPITASVEAEQQADAILKLYDNYEHIMHRELISKEKLDMPISDAELAHIKGQCQSEFCEFCNVNYR